MTTPTEAAAAATFARRDQAQSLSAVKAVIAAAEMWGPDAIVPPQTLRIHDLRSVVEQAEGTLAREEQRAVDADAAYACEGRGRSEIAQHIRNSPLDATPLAAELEKARGEVDSLQASLSAEAERHLATTRERDALREALELTEEALDIHVRADWLAGRSPDAGDALALSTASAALATTAGEQR